MSLPSGSGNPSAKIFIIGEAYGEQEDRLKTPFAGTAGQELDRMLRDAGLMRSDCYVSNVVNARPAYNDITEWIPAKKKDIKSNYEPLRNKWVHPIVLEGLAQLKNEIALVQPKLIIAFGNTPLWALTGADGIMKWRGSLLEYDGIRLVPTLHPAAVLRQWELRSAAINDLRRAARELYNPTEPPKWNFRIRPSMDLAATTINSIRKRMDEGETVWLDLDIETRANHIACIGFSWTRTDALIIPLMCYENRRGYWSEDEEAVIVWLLYKMLTHKNCRVRWQNGLFDAQYIHRYWHFIPHHGQDTMISWHTLFAGQKKSLDYQASLLCEYYVQWKPEKGTWKSGG